jgi:carbonic anhydrase/SulP family sulfate permease
MKQQNKNNPSHSSGSSDVIAGIVVFLVALPLSLGIALASGVPLFSGLLGGIVGGLVVGSFSGSSVSVSGPSAALAAMVVQQIMQLHSFEAFLLALFFAGVFQIILGLCSCGFVAEFFPSSVIKGLLAATGILIVLKQIPHLLGYDPIPFGDATFLQNDGKNTLSEIIFSFCHVQMGSLAIGVTSLLFLCLSKRIDLFQKKSIPTPLLVVLIALGVNLLMRKFGCAWSISSTHLVHVPEVVDIKSFLGALTFPNWKQIFFPHIYLAALMIAVSASLETLLNLEAADKLDPERRLSPPNRELIAQGAGNMLLGCIGGIPITSAIVRTSANINAGGRSRMSTIMHGVLLFGCVLCLPKWLNEIPLSALAAILSLVGAQLARPKLFLSMWKEGASQFIPFITTILAIIFSNLLLGILIGLGVGLLFVLHSSLRSPIQEILERHSSGDVLRLVLPSQVSFLNRPFLMKALDRVVPKSHLLIDAHTTDYIHPDILSLIHDYVHEKAKIRNITVSLIGFKTKYRHWKNAIRFIDYASREVQSKLQPADVLEILRDGNQRFCDSRPLLRDYQRQIQKTSRAQYPMGVILSCIDSRAPVEIIFDAGLGDFFSIRIAGNAAHEKELASMEYACLVAGAKLIVVLGHSSCGAVSAAVDFYQSEVSANHATGCNHLEGLLEEIQKSINPHTFSPDILKSANIRSDYINDVAKSHVQKTMKLIYEKSPSLAHALDEKKIDIIGAFYDVSTGRVEFFEKHQGDI